MAEGREKQFLELNKRLLSLRDQIIKETTTEINKTAKELNDYKIVWQQLQDIASPIIERILKANFKGAVFTITESKSTYPDIKMDWNDFSIAIDIKSSESAKDPWYDVARLDTIIKKRIKKYDEEYELVIEYDSKTKKLLKMFFETLRDTVGINKKCKGVKFRPYDGKLRPKTWEEFDKGITYWKTKEAFLDGITNSQKYRWRKLIKTYIDELSKEDKKEFKDFILTLFQ